VFILHTSLDVVAGGREVRPVEGRVAIRSPVIGTEGKSLILGEWEGESTSQESGLVAAAPKFQDPSFRGFLSGDGL
jgi:hypothetical protein